MTQGRPFTRELSLAARFAAVSMVGFGADAVGLKVGLMAGLGAEVARVASLCIGLQVTFFLSRWLVFRNNPPGTLGRHWWLFMVANTFGSLVNLGVFVGMTRAPWPDLPDPWPDPSGPWVALLVSAGAAYVVNYAGTRLFVYGRDRTAITARPPAAIDS